LTSGSSARASTKGAKPLKQRGEKQVKFTTEESVKPLEPIPEALEEQKDP
jgi:hypothetical protein